jgi:K+-sensing histidine kinase KdpD
MRPWDDVDVTVRNTRGELRIYLGAAPGVGKTFAMLSEAHRRAERGADVVAAAVDTHGRRKTAELLEGVEAVAPRYLDYLGSRVPELDVEAVLARGPQVVLVDELAHTNTPGSKNHQRWQDVQELLDAGITVISTVDIAHLESLSDVVAQITGTEPQETVPDSVVRQASQIELIDIAPEALRRRLSHGNVYSSNMVDAALSNYFRSGNLTALRELTLLWLADQVEARERVVVAVADDPGSKTLVRRVARIAGSISPTERRVESWLAAVVVPAVICAVVVISLHRVEATSGSSALFFVGVLLVALLGGIGPAVLSAVLSGLLLNYFLIAPRHTFAIAEPDAAVTEAVLLVVAIAVAVLVDSAAKRAREASRASREAELLTLFAGSVLRGADLETLLQRVQETYSQRAVSMLRQRADDKGYVVASVGNSPCTAVDAADTAIEVGDDEFWMLMAGRKLAARDRRVLSAVARQAAGLVRQRELAEEAGRADAIVAADELRRSLLSAVSHDLRTPLAAAKVAASSLRAEDVDFCPEDTAELLATIEESIDQLTALVGNLLDSSRLAAGVVHPELRRVYLEEVVQRALVSIGGGATGFMRSGIDWVKVGVDGAVVMADAGLLERVLANLIDNALRYAPGCVVRVNAGRVGDRVLVDVIDEGRGVLHGSEEHLFEAFQRLGDDDNTSGVGLGLSVARGFVEAMGGTIHATDTPGGGLTVVVDLAAPRECRS